MLFLVLLTAVTVQFAVIERVSRPKELTRPRNVLLITIDSLRADCLGCYGHAQAHTPNMDALAAEGVRFDAAFSQASWTWPSVSSIMTSTYVSTHGAWSWNLEISHKLQTLPGLLAAKGWDGHLISGHQGLSDENALTRGMVSTVNADTDRMADAASTALSRIAQDHQFFAWVHLMDAHHTSVEFDTGCFPGRPDYPVFYDGGVAKADAKVGVIVDALKGAGVYEQTLIFVTADHGEGFGSGIYGFKTHGYLLTDELMRVPLIMVHAPGVAGGVVTSKLVEHIDIAPTVCDALDIARPSTFEGFSLLPLLRGEGGESEVVHGENIQFSTSQGDSAIRRGDWSEIRTSARTRDWKLVQVMTRAWAPRYELYNIAEDPAEKFNLAAREPARLAAMVSKLEAWRHRTRAMSVGEPRHLNEQQREDLRNLHYEI